MADAITATEVYRHIKKDPAGDTDVAHMDMTVAAVNHMVMQCHSGWTDMRHLGAVMMAARLYRRRNSVNGIESFSEMGATYVSRYDSDLERLLEIGSWTPPRVG